MHIDGKRGAGVSKKPTRTTGVSTSASSRRGAKGLGATKARAGLVAANDSQPVAPKVVRGSVASGSADTKLEGAFKIYQELMKGLPLEKEYSTVEMLSNLSPKEQEAFMEKVKNLEFLAESFKSFHNILQRDAELYFPGYSTWEKVARLSPEEQLTFLKMVQDLKDYQQQEIKPQGWGEWVRGGVVRAVQFYKEGREISSVAKHVAGNVLTQAKMEAQENISRIGKNIFDTVNSTISSSGNVALGVAGFVVSNTLAGFTIAQLAGIGRNPEEAMREAQQINEAAANIIASRKITETPLQDLTNAVQNTLVSVNGYLNIPLGYLGLEMRDKPVQDAVDQISTWVHGDLKGMAEGLRPEAFLEKLGDAGYLTLAASKVGMKVFPEFLLNAYLMNEFGPKSSSSVIMPSQRMTEVEIGVLTSIIMTTLQMGNASAKQSVIKLLTKGGPGSLKALGIKEVVKEFQKQVLGSVNPMLTPVASYLLTKWGKTTVTGPIKGILKASVGGAIDNTGAAIDKISTRVVEGPPEEPKETKKPAIAAQPATPSAPQYKRKGGTGRYKRGGR